MYVGQQINCLKTRANPIYLSDVGVRNISSSHTTTAMLCNIYIYMRDTYTLYIPILYMFLYINNHICTYVQMIYIFRTNDHLHILDIFNSLNGVDHIEYSKIDSLQFKDEIFCNRTNREA